MPAKRKLKEISYRKLLRAVERTVQTIESGRSLEETILHTSQEIYRQFKKELGIAGGRIYEKEGDVIVLKQLFGEVKEVPVGFKVPENYYPIQAAKEYGVILMDRGTPGVDAALEEKLGVDSFAAISLLDGQFLVTFSFEAPTPKEDTYHILNIFRHALNTKLREEAYSKLLEEARTIQESILPKRYPSLPGFDIYGYSLPAEKVGGDYYDFIEITPSVLGIAIADATGHGLPAALQVRDIYVGLRMGVSREFKMSSSIEKLNKLVARSKLTSRFISLVYGELEQDGVFIYINAGHPSPLIYDQANWKELSVRGMVLGPVPEATYPRGVDFIPPGGLLVLYTDGIVECPNIQGEEFGIPRLKKAIEAFKDQSAQEICDGVFQKLKRFAGGMSLPDDATLVICKRLA